MKALIALLVTLGLSNFAYADAYPVEWALRDAGYIDCDHGNKYYEKYDCDQEYYGLYECNKAGERNKKKTALMVVGVIRSDVVGTCSPTLIVEKIITAK